MIQFSSLRLSGFKSFVDKTELEIGPGLSGIVGPNGCGKSNLVEALRWVMGENSAKRMRGSGMEDVIFSGTDQRSARNFAEVSILLDNTMRTAPSAYNDTDQIEVVRKIEKDKGSGYRINGKNSRARDVQMLFADTVTGANSPSLVSQGHVTRMITAKPQDRRLILEESAGVAGLYARRHEAEIRLKAADTNLIRLEDTLGSMESRLNSLKRQMRQASKYKNISAQIRQLELVLSYLEWQNIIDKQNKIKTAYAEAESAVADKLGTVTQLTKTQTTQIEDLPPLRKQEAELSAKLQKHKMEFQRLEEEAERYKNDLQEAKTQLHQTRVDQQHEEQTLEENTKLHKQIEEEHAALLSEQERDQETYQKHQKERDDLKSQVIALEERFTALKEGAAETRAREEALAKQIERNKETMDTLIERRENAIKQSKEIQLNEDNQKAIDDLETKTKALEDKLFTENDKAADARLEISKTEKIKEEYTKALSDEERTHTEFVAEISFLKSFLKQKDDKNYTPVIDSIVTKPGFEKALSRALGESLMASMDDKAPTKWKRFDFKSKLEDLPEGLTPLLPHIDAPKELHRALSQIGFVENDQQAKKYLPLLKTGQSIVSSEGAFWRWDGFCAESDAVDQQAVHLEQKNKLIQLETKQKQMEAQLDKAQKEAEKATESHDKAKKTYETVLNSVKQTEDALYNLRPALLKIKEKKMQMQSEKIRYEEQIKTLNEDIKAFEDTLQKDQILLNAVINAQKENSKSEIAIDQTKKDLEEKKEEFQNAVRNFDRVEQSRSTRNARIQAISDERISIQNRSIRATEQVRKLKEREATLAQKLEQLESQPIDLENGHKEMLDRLSEIEKQRNAAVEKLAACEEEVGSTTKALKEAESLLSEAREKRAHNQALLVGTDEQLETIEKQIKEQFDLKPTELKTNAALDLVKYQIEDLPKLRAEKEKLARDRDLIGPVNLRAENETTELEKEFTTLLHERNELIQAIGELRGAIHKINKEARERLNTAFERVNAHFQSLFVRLFAGGKAYLELIEGDDPMNSGLEIFAQPPGKALQSLSLLSGGEQTLASIALIFAMFLTNPSPICVLDEIDAPLDDANVDRVCDLLEEIAERGETRFLIITHHRLTMARMDRLYGVTMSEKGVSQLVSVDLQQSFDFIDKKVA